MTDLIRRDDVEKAIQGLHVGDVRFFEKLRKNIDAIPSADPERTAKVKSLRASAWGTCECGQRVTLGWTYCPFCGGKIVRR